MRTAALIVAGASVIALLSWFSPVVWRGAPRVEPTLASISISDLTLAAKLLPTADHHDAH